MWFWGGQKCRPVRVVLGCFRGGPALAVDALGHVRCVPPLLAAPHTTALLRTSTPPGWCVWWGSSLSKRRISNTLVHSTRAGRAYSLAPLNRRDGQIRPHGTNDDKPNVAGVCWQHGVPSGLQQTAGYCAAGPGRRSLLQRRDQGGQQTTNNITTHALVHITPPHQQLSLRFWVFSATMWRGMSRRRSLAKPRSRRCSSSSRTTPMPGQRCVSMCMCVCECVGDDPVFRIPVGMMSHTWIHITGGCNPDDESEPTDKTARGLSLLSAFSL